MNIWKAGKELRQILLTTNAVQSRKNWKWVSYANTKLYSHPVAYSG
jgi:hypothetical protein